jgi:hypothetical protein
MKGPDQQEQTKQKIGSIASKEERMKDTVRNSPGNLDLNQELRTRTKIKTPFPGAHGGMQSAFVGIALLANLWSVARADVVTDWNTAMNEYAAPLDGAGVLPPYIETRVYAMAHIAMLNAIEQAQQRHPGAANTEAAGVQAAHDVLVHEFAPGAGGFDTLLTSQLNAIPEGSAKANGIALGAQAAAQMLASRANDGSANPDAPYTPGPNPGDYQFTPPFDGPPFNGYAAGENWGMVTPFALRSGDQFRAPPPYRVTDLEYTFDVNEIKALGAANSAGRSDDQTQLAIFWYESCGLGWNRVARLLETQHPHDLAGSARVFATLNAALADGYIASIESKYTYNFWRPITAIRLAATDGNDLTSADPTWEPLLLTPPIPDYPSAHAAVGGAASAVLIAFYGDENTFTSESTMSAAFPNVEPRTFHHVSDAAKENAISRMMVGIHFRLACVRGYEQGLQVGNWVVRHLEPGQSHPNSNDADVGHK